MPLFPVGSAADIGDAVPSDYWAKLGQLLNGNLYYSATNPDFGGGADPTGATDSRAAIEAMWTAGGPGKLYLYPPGTYLINSGSGLSPPANSMHLGCHSPRWDITDGLTSSACRFLQGGSFAGTGLFKPADSSKGVTLSHLGIAGNGVAGGTHGLQMPDIASVTGEQGWTLEHVTISGFTGDGLYGRFHVWHFSNVWVQLCRGWGINASVNNNRWNDCHWYGGNICYNRTGGVFFGGGGQSALVNFTGTRIERQGNQYTVPLTPFTADAPGLRIENALACQFNNVQTDANTGAGVQITPGTGGAAKVALLQFGLCHFKRDGGGNQTTLTDKGAVHVVGGSTTTGTDGANKVEFYGCNISSGKSDDAGGGIVSPKYGVWYQNTERFKWHGHVDDAATAPYHRGGAASTVNFQAEIIDTRRGILTIPSSAPSAPIPDQAIWYDTATSTIKVRHNDTTTKSTAALT